MDVTNLSVKQRELIEETTRLPFVSIAGISDEICDRVVDGRRKERRFQNAVDDFFTVVLLTSQIDANEDWIRVEMLRCIQLLEGAQLHAAIMGTDSECEQMARRLRQDRPVLLVLRYLRSTRSDMSASTESRDRWLTFPDAPPDSCKELFQSIIDFLRSKKKQVHPGFLWVKNYDNLRTHGGTHVCATSISLPSFLI